MKSIIITLVSLFAHVAIADINQKDILDAVHLQNLDSSALALWADHEKTLDARGFESRGEQQILVKFESHNELREPVSHWSPVNELELLPSRGELIIRQSFSKHLPRKEGQLGRSYEEVTINAVVLFKLNPKTNSYSYRIIEVRSFIDVAHPEGNSSSAG